MNSPYYRPSSYEEQLLYDHFISCRKVESPEDLLERFRCLFIDGMDYPEPTVLETVHRLITSRLSETEFKFVLNRCCRILINYWWFQPSYRWAIAHLVHLFEASPRGMTRRLDTQRLRRLVDQFTQTEEYKSLQRLAHVVEDGKGLDSPEPSLGQSAHQYQSQKGQAATEQARSLQALIHRYPYLYPYCLGGQNSSETECETIRQLQAERQQKFEYDLLRYVTSLIQEASHPSRSRNMAAKNMAKNPTLLSEDQLKTTVKHFTGQVEGSATYADLARRFQNLTSQKQSYRSFKEALYRYLITSVDSKYSKQHFDQWLQTQLKNTLPQSDTQPLNAFLVTRTCQQLLEALVASPQNANPQNVSNHLVFIDLINNVGATATVGLLLKILLLYKNLKSTLEKRFALLFKHYETLTSGVEWLIESLENLQIAFCIHFGSVEFPCLKQI
jgi:hypothetical protein